MAKAFLDTNVYIDFAYRKPQIRSIINAHQIYLSPLSFHILCYVNKIKIPTDELQELRKYEFNIIDFTEEILNKALMGPTKDFEDNVQLHSAAEAQCDIFLTSDTKLLNMKFFGKAKIESILSTNLWPK